MTAIGFQLVPALTTEKALWPGHWAGASAFTCKLLVLPSRNAAGAAAAENVFCMHLMLVLSKFFRAQGIRLERPRPLNLELLGVRCR